MYMLQTLGSADYFNSLPHNPTFNDREEEGFLNIVGKGENAGYQHFLLFPQCFLPSYFWATFIMLSANASNLHQTKILSFGKELTC